MRKLSAIIIVTFFFSLGIARSEKKEALDALLKRINSVPDREGGLSEKEQLYIQKILHYEKDAIPRLVELLSHSDMDVAVIAAAALGDCKRIDEKHLPKIIKGLDRGIGWLPSALGKIESDQAAQEAVKRYIKAPTSPDNQEAYAVERQGARALPFILQAVKADNGQDERTYYLLGHIIGEMGAVEQKQAALSLMNILKERQSSIELKRAALKMVRHLHKGGLVIEKDLIDFGKVKRELREDVNMALVGIRSSHAGRIYAGLLKRRPNILLLRDISEVGKHAKDAGEEVLKLLNHSDWEMRHLAARTLGFIEYEEATPKLIELLGDSSDVIINWIAAQSLGRLHAKSAKHALKTTVDKHWHPAVRKEAARALVYIKSLKPYKSRYHPDNFPLEFFDYQNWSIESPEPEADLHKIQSNPKKFYLTKSPVVLKKLSYKRAAADFGASDKKKHIQIPDVALQVKNGWLVSSDRGEWGGELVYVGNKGEQYFLLNENVQDVYTLGKRRIAVSGLAHLTCNYGMVYELTRGPDDKWKANPWRTLPGAPRSSRKITTGEIYISTYGGGGVILSSDGSFRMTVAK